MYRSVIVRIILLVSIARQIVTAEKFYGNPCPENFQWFRNVCYYFSDSVETFDAAYFKCSERNSTLAVPINQRQQNQLKKYLLKGYVGNSERWIGGRYDWKKNRWKWADSGRIIRFDQFAFNDKYPLEWQCLFMDPSVKYKWNKDVCMHSKHYICQTNSENGANSSWSSQNGTNGTLSDSLPGYSGYVITADALKHRPAKKKKKAKNFICPDGFHLVRKKCYHFSSTKEKWHSAYYKCNDINSELAVLTNMNQDKKLQASLKKFAISKDERWIGGIYDWKNRYWKWAKTGKKVWQKVLGSENQWQCLIWNPSIARWHSGKCTLPKYYVCQSKAKMMIDPVTKVKTDKLNIEVEVNVTNATANS